MNIVEQSVKIVDDLDGEEILSKLERCGRKCYKSEGNIKDGSKEKFLANIIRLGHESVLEHVSITVDVTTSRDISHQIVRHRIGSISQESQRFCNYSKGRFSESITFIKPEGIDENSESYEIWLDSCAGVEKDYFDLIAMGEKAEDARKVLPNSTKTELMMTMNIRSWRNFFQQRTAKDAQLDIRILANMILKEFKDNIPVLFDDINPEEV